VPLRDSCTVTMVTHRASPRRLPLNDRPHVSQRCNSPLLLATYRGNTPFAYQHWRPPGNLWRDKAHYLRRCNRSRRSARSYIARAPRLRSGEIPKTLDYRRSRKGGKGGRPRLSPLPPALAMFGASRFLAAVIHTAASRQTLRMRLWCLGMVHRLPPTNPAQLGKLHYGASMALRPQKRSPAIRNARDP
jgi:hypothetical protein